MSITKDVPRFEEDGLNVFDVLLFSVMGVNEAEALQSDVYKMVHENDTRGAPQNQGYNQAPQYDMGGGYGGMDNGVGASDF